MKSIQKIFRFLLCLLCLLFAVLLIQNAPVVAKGAVQGIRLCLQTVIPSLFCFMVLTCFLINSGLYRFLSLPLAWVTRRLFFLPPELGSILLLEQGGLLLFVEAMHMNENLAKVILRCSSSKKSTQEMPSG